jgi:hypothetical protein
MLYIGTEDLGWICFLVNLLQKISIIRKNYQLYARDAQVGALGMQKTLFCLNLKLFESDHNPSALLEIPLQM